MALTANVTITILDRSARKARFVGTVTDSETGTSIEAVILETVVDTSQLASELERIVGGLFADYEAKQTEADGIAALIASWKSALTTALQARLDA